MWDVVFGRVTVKRIMKDGTSTSIRGQNGEQTDKQVLGCRHSVEAFYRL